MEDVINSQILNILASFSKKASLSIISSYRQRIIFKGLSQSYCAVSLIINNPQLVQFPHSIQASNIHLVLNIKLSYKHQKRPLLVRQSSSQKLAHTLEQLQWIDLVIPLFIIMHRNQQISKQTEDKVKLAKQYIESRYKAIIEREQQQRMGWKKILKALAQTPLPQAEKKAVAVRALARESSNTRLLRVKNRLDNYQLQNIIGKGAFGEVRLARNKENQEVVAIKRMAKSKLMGKKQMASVFLERQCLSRSKSRWLVELKSAFQDKEYLYIAMQWVPGGDLLRLLIDKDIFTEDETRFYVSELILAIEDMHRIHYIHRDIKPDNILIGQDGHLKLTDFGLSKQLDPTPVCQPRKHISSKDINGPRSSLKRLMSRKQRQFSKVGTPDYIAPEVLTEESYDHRVDIWSVGVIMFECLFGYPPFSHEDSKQVCQRVIHWQDYLIFPQNPKVSLQAKLLVLGMLSPKDHRLTIQQIKAHPFFLGFDWNKVTQMVPPFKPELSHQLDTHNFDTFQEEAPWVSQHPSGQCERAERQTHARRSSSVGYQYNFAGFDWQPSNKTDLIAKTLKQIESMQQNRPPSSQTMKRLHTQQAQSSYTRKTRQFCKGRNSVKAFQKGSKKEEKQPLLRKIGLKGKSIKVDI